jgi:rubrerythrin
MPVLKSEPPGPVTSTEQLMAIALMLEQEASSRYTELSVRMRLQKEESLAELFAFLSRIEARHVAHLQSRAQTLIGTAAPAATATGWEVPESFDEEAARSASLTPYNALAIAVRNEERAFALYSYIAAHAANDALRLLAEDLAKEELDHAGLLRRERRKAWRQEGGGPAARQRETRPETRPETLAELLAQSAAAEAAAGQAHRELTARLRTAGQELLAALFQEAAEDEEALAREIALGSAPAPGKRVTALSVRDGLRLLEHAFDRYTDVVETTHDEQVMLTAQHLAERALSRLTYVRGSMDQQPLETGPDA